MFQDNELVEALGRQSPTYSYTIPFREDIVAGRWKNLFTEVYPEFLEACLDHTSGVLEDPVHGSVLVKCVSLRETVDVNRRDGVDVQAEFVLAPEFEDIQGDLGTQIRTLQGASDQAGLFDREAKKVDWHQEEPPEPTQDIFDTISSATNQIEAIGNKLTAGLADVAFRMEKATASIDRLKNPKLAPLRAQARRVQIASLDLQEKAQEPPKPTRVLETAADITLLALAGVHGLALRDFLLLNPVLASYRLVPRGTKVKVFA